MRGSQQIGVREGQIASVVVAMLDEAAAGSSLRIVASINESQT